MQLSPHFTLEEFTRNGQGTDNTPSAGAISTLEKLCVILLEPIRDHVGAPITITSGYRSPELNAAVGGVSNSYHVATAAKAAADFRCPDMESVFDWIRLESGLKFDQAILEREANGEIGCIHVQIGPIPRRMALVGMTHGQSGYTQVEVR